MSVIVILIPGIISNIKELKTPRKISLYTVSCQVHLAAVLLCFSHCLELWELQSHWTTSIHLEQLLMTFPCHQMMMVLQSEFF